MKLAAHARYIYTGLVMLRSTARWSEVSCCNCVLGVSAHPSSVSVLAGMEHDVRTADKLVDRVNDCGDGTHSWLAPILPGQVTQSIFHLYLVFLLH